MKSDKEDNEPEWNIEWNAEDTNDQVRDGHVQDEVICERRKRLSFSTCQRLTQGSTVDRTKLLVTDESQENNEIATCSDQCHESEEYSREQ